MNRLVIYLLPVPDKMGYLEMEYLVYVSESV
jgi:hypothetical protein